MSILSLRHAAWAAMVLMLAACGADAPESAASAPAASPASAPAPTAGAPEATAAVSDVGEQTYKKICSVCHGTPAMGAPVLGNKDDWAPRIAQGKDTLYRHALEGYVGEKGAMPAHGGNPGLDDATVKAAVDYMVAQAR